MPTDDSTLTGDAGAAVSAKSTKHEILAAYQQLLQGFQRKAENAKLKKETKQAFEQEVVQKASSYSIENILEAIVGLDSSVRKTLHELGEQLVRESQKLRELQEAIRIEGEKLEKTKNIKVEIDTLENLLEAQRAQKQTFEEDMAQQEEEFYKSMQSKKDGWKREQEEYEYELSLNRRKEENEYAEKRAEQEAELAQRERAVAAAEQELAGLREKAAKFQAELEKAVAEAKEKTEREVLREEQVKADLLREKSAAEQRIAALTIDTLKGRVAALENEVESLKAQLANANKEVKDVAVKVIEGHSRHDENERLSKLLAEQKGRSERQKGE